MRITTPDPELSDLLFDEYMGRSDIRENIALRRLDKVLDGCPGALPVVTPAHIEYFRAFKLFPLIEPYLIDRDWSEEELTARRVAYLLTKD